MSVDRIEQFVFNLENMSRDMALVYFQAFNPGVVSRDTPTFMVWYETNRSTWYRIARVAVKGTIEQVQQDGA